MYYRGGRGKKEQNINRKDIRSVWRGTISLSFGIIPIPTTTCYNVGECVNGTNSPTFFYPVDIVCSPVLPCIKYTILSSLYDDKSMFYNSYRGYYMQAQTDITRIYQRPALHKKTGIEYLDFIDIR